jgi:hypothetical protein
MKPLAIAVSGVGRRSREGDGGGGLNDVQCKPISDCHNESPRIFPNKIIKVCFSGEGPSGLQMTIFLTHA